MTEQQVRDLIENFIVTNGVNAITANVLRPILVAILEQTNDYIGTLGNLQTVNKDNLVDAINEVIGYISSINNDGVKLYQGNLSPLVTPPPAYNTADFYYEILEQTLWQFNGVQWIRIVGNSTSINTPYKDKLFYSGSNTFTLPNNVIALDVRINGDGDNINWTQLGNSLNYSGVMTSGDFLVVIGIITNVPFTTLNSVTQRIFTVMLSDIGATDFNDDIPGKIKTYAIANGIQKLPNETHDWEVTENFNFYLRISGTDMYDNYGIEDESTFVSYLSGYGATNIAVTDFYLSADTLRCNLSFDGTTGLDLNYFGISKIVNLDSLVNLTFLDLSNNQLTVIENLDSLVNLTQLYLENNQLTTSEFNKLNSWAILAPNNGGIYTSDNIDNFNLSTTYTTLLAKGWTIYT